MIQEVAVGDRRRKNDRRSVNNWVGRMKLVATREGQQYFLAALYDIFDASIEDEDVKEAYRGIADVAARKRREYYEACGEDDHMIIVNDQDNAQDT